jgi:hypothetical protein
VWSDPARLRRQIHPARKQADLKITTPAPQWRAQLPWSLLAYQTSSSIFKMQNVSGGNYCNLRVSDKKFVIQILQKELYANGKDFFVLHYFSYFSRETQFKYTLTWWKKLKTA